MTIALSTLVASVVLLLVLVVVARRHLSGQRGRRTAVDGDAGATFTYLGSDAGHCSTGSDSGSSDGGGCDGGGGGGGD